MEVFLILLCIFLYLMVGWYSLHYWEIKQCMGKSTRIEKLCVILVWPIGTIFELIEWLF